MALNNMTQGVVMVDDKERVLVCNERYVAMYGLSPEIVKPGCTLRDLIKNRIFDRQPQPRPGKIPRGNPRVGGPGAAS